MFRTKIFEIKPKFYPNAVLWIKEGQLAPSISEKLKRHFRHFNSWWQVWVFLCARQFNTRK